jgi:hypothetical protein
VTDDYYEEVAREECAEKGIEPGSLVPDKPFLVETDQQEQRQPERSAGAPFYVPGGPTPHWGSAGWNPWHGAGMGNKRARLQGQGLTTDNWMWRMAIDAREREREIREAREDRLQDFSGERLTVYSELHSNDESAKGGVKPVAAEEDKSEVEEKPTILRPAANDIRGLFEQDAAFRKEYRRMTGSKAFEPSLLVDGALETGNIMVESEAETASRKRRKAIPVKAGEYRGFYEVCRLEFMAGRRS